MGKWSSKDIKFIKDHKGQLNINELCLYFGNKHKKQHIQTKHHALQIPIKKLTSEERSLACRKCTVNDEFFNVWSYNMAYILGLFVSDGFIYTKNNTVGFGFKEEDRYLLEFINYYTQSDYKIIYKKNTRSSQLQISSKKFMNSLLALLNLQEPSNKTFIIDFPNMPKEFLPSFIRGVFDGDGSVYFSKHHQCYKSSICSASIQFIDGLEKAINILDPTIIMSREIRKNGLIILALSKANTLLLGQLIYSTPPGDMYLKRKYEKFKDASLNYSSKKLDVVKVQEIRKLISNGYDNNYIKTQFNISTTCLWRIKTRKSWKHVN